MSPGPLHRPAAMVATDGWACAVGPEDAGWSYSGLRVLDLPAGGSRTFDTGPDEVLVLPLGGSCAVDCDGESAELAGRADVWSGPTDFGYLPVGSRVTVSSADGGRFALPAARAERRLPFRTVAAKDVPVELRGAGACSRQVNNFCTPDSFEADRLIACELLTPAGNWSSYPPHKHDEDRPGESVLEEIYYYEIAPVGGYPGGGVPGGSGSGGFTGGGASGGSGSGGFTGGGAPRGFAYQRVYGTAERPVDVLAEVRTGDVVLVPRGWHGPTMAAPGYDLYYLNVMAGPGERAWRIRDDPAHAWVRDTWRDQQVDPRLPWRTPCD